MILSLVCSFIIALSLPPCMLPTQHLNYQCSWSIIYDFSFRSLYSNFGSISCSIHALLLYMCDQSFSYLNLSIFHYQLSPPFFFSFGLNIIDSVAMCVVSHDYKNYTPITYNITGNKKGLFQENWAR